MKGWQEKDFSRHPRLFRRTSGFARPVTHLVQGAPCIQSFLPCHLFRLLLYDIAKAHSNL